MEDRKSEDRETQAARQNLGRVIYVDYQKYGSGIERGQNKKCKNAIASPFREVEEAYSLRFSRAKKANLRGPGSAV
jgi:hypothetical protein